MAIVLHCGHFRNARRPFQAATGAKNVRSDAEQSLWGKLLKEFFDILVELLGGFLGVLRQNVRGLPSPDEFSCSTVEKIHNEGADRVGFLGGCGHARSNAPTMPKPPSTKAAIKRFEGVLFSCSHVCGHSHVGALIHKTPSFGGDSSVDRVDDAVIH